MTDNNQTQQQYGEIKEGGFIMRVHVGDVTADDGTKFEVAQSMNGEPLVCYGNRVFILTWTDICHMAEDAGLFKKDDGAQ